MNKADIRSDLAGRLTEEYVVDQRNTRFESNSERMARYDETDRLYRGDWSFLDPAENNRSKKPKVMNQVQVELDDIGALVSETKPSIRVPARGDSQTATAKAAVREAIFYGYWSYNRADRLVPITAMDITGCGVAFWLVTPKPGFAYPAIMRLDPRSCYPTIINNELIDLMHITKMRGRTLRQKTGIDDFDDADHIELIGFYDSEEWAELAYSPSKKGNGVWVKEPKMHGLKADGQGLVPVAFAQRDTFDGYIRGMFDQMGGTLEAKNRIAENILDGADQALWSPIIEYETENAGDFGPLSVIHLNSKDSRWERAQPPQLARELFALMQLLGDEGRQAGGYPPQRQGQDVGSIISGAGVTSTQGQLTTNVRNADRLMGYMREQVNRIGGAIEEKYLDYEKPLCRTVGSKKTYTPSRDLNGEYDNDVVTSPIAGLDKANQIVMLLQLKGARLMSNETIMGLLPDIIDSIGEMDKIDREDLIMAVKQMLVAGAGGDLAMLLQALVLSSEGDSIEEIAKKLTAQAQAKAAQEQAGPQQPAGPQEMGPEQVQAQQTSMEKGGIPGKAPELADFQPDMNLFVNAGRG